MGAVNAVPAGPLRSAVVAHARVRELVQVRLTTTGETVSGHRPIVSSASDNAHLLAP
jgi:hypothetical protein